MRCERCHGADYVPAPPTNAWRLYFARHGNHHANVLVPCPACGGIFGKINRRKLAERLAERKRNGTFPAALMASFR